MLRYCPTLNGNTISDADTAGHSIGAYRRDRRRRRRRRIDARAKVHHVELTTSLMLSAIILTGLHRIEPTAAFVSCHYLDQRCVQFLAPLATTYSSSYRPRCFQPIQRPNGPTSSQIKVVPALFAAEEKHYVARVSIANENGAGDGDDVGVGDDDHHANAYELVGSDAEWREYYDIADSVLSEAKTFGRKDKEKDKFAVREYLLRRQCMLPIHLPTLTSKAADGEVLPTAASSLPSELEAQKSLFCEASGLSSAQQKLAIRVLGYIGNMSAKKRLYLPLRVGWHKLKEMGASPRENVLSTYLYGLALAEGTREEATKSKGMSTSLPEEVATFHDSLFHPTEKTLTLRIKALVQKGDALGAERLLEMMPVSPRKLMNILTLTSFIAWIDHQYAFPSLHVIFTHICFHTSTKRATKMEAILN